MRQIQLTDPKVNVVDRHWRLILMRPMLMDITTQQSVGTLVAIGHSLRAPH